MPTYSTIPFQTVSALVSAHPVTRAELHTIRDRRDPVRFCGVYRHVHGSRQTKTTTYRARVLRLFELGSGFVTAEDAARAIVAFYKANYGDKWHRAFLCRKANPWRLRTVRKKNHSESSRTATTYAVDVYIRGNPVGVTHADVSESGKEDQWVWATVAEAKQAARVAMCKWMKRESHTLTVPSSRLLFWRG